MPKNRVANSRKNVRTITKNFHYGEIFAFSGERWTIFNKLRVFSTVSVNSKMNSLLRKVNDIWQKFFLKLSVRRYRNDFRKKMKIVKKFETIGLNLCESCNLISYRDQDIVEWNRSGILLVTSILITMIMMTIAIFDGFPAPMGCAPKTCFTVIYSYEFLIR